MAAAQNTSAGHDEPLEESAARQEVAADSLTPLERAVIELEKRRFRYQGSKEQAIEKQLGLSPVAVGLGLETPKREAWAILNPEIVHAFLRRRIKYTR